jgi:endonuclease/exonuclease/phosphatase family metal-dependent hydrolase
MDLKLATYNIRNTTDRYDERRQLLCDTVAGVDFHVCGLQEVRYLPDAGLVDQSEELTVGHPNSLVAYKAPLRTPYLSADDKFRIDGNCILVNTDAVVVVDHAVLELSDARSAQRITFHLKDNSTLCSYTNVHLHHQLESVDENIRLDQINRTLEWMNALDKTQNVNVSFLGGDFNAPPHEKAYERILGDRFVSMYLEYCGEEPEKTFPTGNK